MPYCHLQRVALNSCLCLMGPSPLGIVDWVRDGFLSQFGPKELLPWEFVFEKEGLGERDLVHMAGMWTWKLWMSVFDPKVDRAWQGNSSPKRCTQILREKQKWKRERVHIYPPSFWQSTNSPFWFSFKFDNIFDLRAFKSPFHPTWLSQVQWISVSRRQ